MTELLHTLSSSQMFVLALLAVIFVFALLMRVLNIIGDRIHVEVEIEPDADPAPSTGKTAIAPKADGAAPAAPIATAQKDLELVDPTDWQTCLFEGLAEALTAALPFSSRALAARIMSLRSADLAYIVINDGIAREFSDDVAELDLSSPGGYGATPVIHVKDGKLADYQAAVNTAIEYAEALALSVKWPDGASDGLELMSEALDEAVATPSAALS